MDDEPNLQLGNRCFTQHPSFFFLVVWNSRDTLLYQNHGNRHHNRFLLMFGQAMPAFHWPISFFFDKSFHKKSRNLRHSKLRRNHQFCFSFAGSFYLRMEELVLLILELEGTIFISLKGEMAHKWIVDRSQYHIYIYTYNYINT